MPVLSLAHDCHLPHNTPHKPSRYNNEQTAKQTKAINNSCIYIHISCKCDTNRAGHFTLDAYASRPVACLSNVITIATTSEFKARFLNFLHDHPFETSPIDPLHTAALMHNIAHGVWSPLTVINDSRKCMPKRRGGFCHFREVNYSYPHRVIHCGSASWNNSINTLP